MNKVVGQNLHDVLDTDVATQLKCSYTLNNIRHEVMFSAVSVVHDGGHKIYACRTMKEAVKANKMVAYKTYKPCEIGNLYRYSDSLKFVNMFDLTEVLIPQFATNVEIFKKL